MKNAQRLFVLLCLCLPMGVFAQSIAGNWETKIPNEDGTMMTVKLVMGADGTYAVDLGGDGTTDIRGKYEMKDGQMNIQDTGGEGSCQGKGVYKVTSSGSTMTMTRVSDECEGRGGPEGVMQWTKA